MRKSDEIKQKLYDNKELKAEERNTLITELIEAEKQEAKENEEVTNAMGGIQSFSTRGENNEPSNFSVLGSQLPSDKKPKNLGSVYKLLQNKALTVEDMNELRVSNLSSTDGSSGGYLIPLDQNNKIEELARELVDLSKIVRIKPTKTKIGSINNDTGKEYEDLPLLVEGDEIVDESSKLEFKNIKFEIKEYAGIIKIPNNLLNDNAADLKSYINRWLLKRGIATKNKLILEEIKKLDKVAITKLDELKDTLNVKLDPSIKKKSNLITNQDGFNFLDKLKDANDKYLLQDNPTKDTEKMLFGRPIYTLKNALLPTATGKVPLIVGSFKDLICLVDRQQTSLLPTNQSSEAFKKNETHVRAIIRLDVVTDDDKGAIYNELTIS